MQTITFIRDALLTAYFMALSIYCVAVVIVSIDAVRVHERAIIITGER